MFFTCRSCLAKDNHIADLKAQVARLESLVFPQTKTTPSEDNIAFNQVAAGGDYINPAPMSPDELEAHLLLTGSWDDAGN